MRCSKCQVNLDHTKSYTFLVKGRTVIMCEPCYEAYMDKIKADAIAAKKTRRPKK